MNKLEIGNYKNIAQIKIPVKSLFQLHLLEQQYPKSIYNNYTVLIKTTNI